MILTLGSTADVMEYRINCSSSFRGRNRPGVAVVMPGNQGPWHLGLNDTQSIAYKNVRIYRPTETESLQQVSRE